MKPYFSILVPVYNKQGQMDNCIDSLKNQTFGDYEIIIVDDGSTDGSYAELLQYAKEDNRVKVIRHECNKSLFAARYTAMQQARGKYVLFLDSDDSFTPDACETLYDFLNENPVDIVCFGLRFVGDESYNIMPVETDDLLKSFMDGAIYPTIWKNCYSIHVIQRFLEKDVEPFYCNTGEDTCYSTMLYSCAASFANLNKVLHYYDGLGGMTHTKTEVKKANILRDIDSVRASAEHVLDFIKKYNPGYEEPANRAIRTMFRFVVKKHVLYAPDLKNAVEFLNVFDTEELKPYFEYGCNVILPYKVMSENGQAKKPLNIVED